MYGWDMLEGHHLILLVRRHIHVVALFGLCTLYKCCFAGPVFSLKLWESVEDKVRYHHFHFDRQDPHSTAAALDTCILEGIKTQIFTGQVLVIAVQCYLCIISMKVESFFCVMYL